MHVNWLKEDTDFDAKKCRAMLEEIEENSLRKLIREEVKCALKEFYMGYEFNIKIDEKEIKKLLTKNKKDDNIRV